MKLRVLVTSAGAGPAVAVIKALRRLDQGFEAHVLAVDASLRAAGLYLAGQWRQVPRVDDPRYLETLLGICREESLDMIIPIFDAEAGLLARHRARFATEGIHVAVNPPACTEAANDKLASSEVCRANGIRQPASYEAPDRIPAAGFPVLGKPLRGVGSKDLIVLEGPEDAARVSVPPGRYLWQQYVRGAEYTIDTFGAADGPHFVAVPRFRRVVRAGQMVQGCTVDDPTLIEFARRICRAFGSTDVCCVQAIRGEDGELYFVEINPRYGTGVSLSIAAGVSFPTLQWLSHFDPDRITPDMLRFKPGVEMIRYWEEVYRDVEDLDGDLPGASTS